MKAYADTGTSRSKDSFVEVEILGKYTYDDVDSYLCKDSSGKMFTSILVYLPLDEPQQKINVQKEDEIYWQGYADGYQDALDDKEPESPLI